MDPCPTMHGMRIVATIVVLVIAIGLAMVLR